MVKRGQKIITEEKTDKAFWAMAIIVLSMLLMGFYDGPQELVEAEYVVKEGDCLRNIAWEYLEKNTGSRRYILEFEDGIRELNPELWHTCQIYPGQVIKINYWVKK